MRPVLEITTRDQISGSASSVLLLLAPEDFPRTISAQAYALGAERRAMHAAWPLTRALDHTPSQEQRAETTAWARREGLISEHTRWADSGDLLISWLIRRGFEPITATRVILNEAYACTNMLSLEASGTGTTQSAAAELHTLAAQAAENSGALTTGVRMNLWGAACDHAELSERRDGPVKHLTLTLRASERPDVSALAILAGAERLGYGANPGTTTVTGPQGRLSPEDMTLPWPEGQVLHHDGAQLSWNWVPTSGRRAHKQHEHSRSLQ